MCTLFIQVIATISLFSSSITAASFVSDQDKVNVYSRSRSNLISIQRRDRGGSCSSDYNYWTLTCPVTSNNCLSDYQANAFYQDGECDCVCNQNGSGRRDPDVKFGTKPLQDLETIDAAKVIAFRDRRDLGGSCSSDYDYWTFTCPVKSNNCLSGYHANAFYQDGKCNCVCDQNISRRRDPEVKNGLKRRPKPLNALKKISLRDRRAIGGSCSSNYDYWTLSCPVDSDNCLPGYHPNAHYDIDDSQCNCECEKNSSRRRDIKRNAGHKQEKIDTANVAIASHDRRNIGGTCSSVYDFFGRIACEIISDNCLQGYHVNPSYGDGQCDCTCEQD
eukprot:Awhi_evm1s10768